MAGTPFHRARRSGAAWEKLLFRVYRNHLLVCGIGSRMALSFRSMASGPGWSVSDIVCTAGPHDRPFEEQHAAVCIAAVTQGTFQYRATSGAAILATGAVLLGNEGTCFECRHEHGTGDRCLSFHVDSDLMEGIVAAVPG